MAGKGDIRAGSAYVEIGVRGLQTAQRSLQSLGASVAQVGGVIAGIGAGIVGPLVAAVHHFTEVGGAIDDMSARTGVARTELAQLGYAAEQSGASLDDIERAIRNQQRQGIAGTFDEVAASIAAIQDPAARAKRAIEVWGRSGTMLLPMLENLQAFKSEARGLGIGVSEEDIKLADALGDSFAKVKAQLSAAVFNVGAALAPMLLKATELVSGIVRGVTAWTNENRGVVQIVAMIGAGLLAVGTVIAAIGGGLVVAGAILGSIATLLPIIATVAAAVLSPVGLIVTAVVAIGAGLAAALVYWVRFTAAGQKAFASLMAVLRPFAQTLKTAFGGIIDALKGGSIELAFQVMVAGLKLLWAQFTEFAIGKFLSLIEAVAGNPIVQQVLGEGMAGDIKTMSRTARAEQNMAVRALKMELDKLRAQAAAGVPKAAEERPMPGMLGGEFETGISTQRASVTAATTAQAIGLTFGQRRPGEFGKDMLAELKATRQFSIKAHRELLREMREAGRFAP